MKQENKWLMLKRTIAIITLLIAIGLVIWLSFFVTKTLMISSKSEGGIATAAAEFKNLIDGYGAWGVVVAFGIQMLQVIVSPIPGEVIEVGMGICFGWFGGAVICLTGSLLSAAIVMVLIKKFGTKVVELFISREKLDKFKFINNEEKVKYVAFLLYFIPGTPKDALVFFFGLTKIKIRDFLIIQTVARIPSVISSTIAGHFAVEQDFKMSLIIFAVTGVLALLGLLFYKKIVQKIQQRKEKKKSEN